MVAVGGWVSINLPSDERVGAGTAGKKVVLVRYLGLRAVIYIDRLKILNLKPTKLQLKITCL